jgi:DNA-binding XRE family transcriptional regulator
MFDGSGRPHQTLKLVHSIAKVFGLKIEEVFIIE